MRTWVATDKALGFEVYTIQIVGFAEMTSLAIFDATKKKKKKGTIVMNEMFEKTSHEMLNYAFVCP